MRSLAIAAIIAVTLAVAGCSHIPRDGESGVFRAPKGVHSGPSCRVWDEDMFGRRYCRVRYVYDAPSRN